MIWLLEHLLKSVASNQAEIGGRWVPARPVSGPFPLRLKAAWLVLTGRADAVVWPAGQ